MIDVLTRVQAGQMLVAPSTFSAAPTAGSGRAPEGEVRPQLTRREQEVLNCLGRGNAGQGASPGSSGSAWRPAAAT